MSSRKTIGWIVLAAGLALIGGSVNTSYQYFSGRADFPPVFKASAAPQSNNGTPAAPANPADLQAQAQEAISKATFQAVAGIFPAEQATKLLNAICWSLFATFLVYTGAKIADIGVKMIA